VTIMASLDDRIEQEVASLCCLHRSELAERWETIYGVRPPKGARRVLLQRAIAWHIQAQVFRGIKKEILRALLKGPTAHARNGPRRAGLADSDAAVDIDIRVPSRQRAIRPLPSSGARLVRDWRGKTHVVDVTQDGYVWQGKSYSSLSVIAREITGARWSGPRFFGL
jgi:hypothetical protein